MNLFLPLRWRLTFWYSTIVLVSLISFAAFAYYWVFNELYTNLDSSLIKISNTLSLIIEDSATESADNRSKEKFAELLLNGADKFALFRKEEKSRFIGPLRPVISKKDRNKRDIVWSAIFKHILLNPENYFIQIADTGNRIIWKSRNLGSYDLPLDKSYYQANNKDTDTEGLFFDNVILDQDKLRLLVNKNNYAVISIGYTVKDVTNTLRSLFSSLLLAVPVILIVSIAGGIILSKMSLRPVDKVTKTAQEISAKNLSLRLNVHPTHDEISRLVETFNNMIQRLERSFIQIRQFTSDASHELRTPLTILRGEIEIALSKERPTDRYIEVLGSALEEVIRLSNVVDSLLELSRADAGQTKMHFERNNISMLVTDIIEDMEIIAEDRNITVESDINEKIFLYFDKARIHQAILNLIDNAIKYTNPGGKIITSVRGREHYVEIKISDSGIGMTQDELVHIFDRFYRVDKARAADIKGTGLGLSIVKWIIESHNGKIFVESQPDRGTNFIVMLPKEQIVKD